MFFCEVFSDHFCYLVTNNELMTEVFIEQPLALPGSANNLPVVLEIIISKFSYCLKIMSRNTFPEPQAGIAS